MVDLTRNDVNFVVSRIPKDLRELLVKNEGLMVGGGFIRATIAREKSSDIDIFGPTETLLKLAAQDLALLRKGRIHNTDNALTVLAHPRLPVQFITRWLFDNPDDTIKSFDFTIAQAVIVPVIENGKLTAWTGRCSEGFYPDLAARRLVYTAPERNEDAGGSLLRVRKFLSKGYTIQAHSLAGVVARLIKSIDFTKMDPSYEKGTTQVITGLLREVDPLMIIDGLDAIDEHEIEGGTIE